MTNYDIHPESISKLTGETYAEVVASAMTRQSTNFEQTQALLNKSLFTAPEEETND
jgi:hypothetical protein